MSALEPDIVTTSDAFLGGRLDVLQPAKGPRAGIDAVLLAAAIPAKANERALEAGAGAGVVALALARRVPGLDLVGIEIQPELLTLAEENARRNGLEAHVRLVAGDLNGSVRQLEAKGLSRESFDHVLANPPFETIGQAQPAPDEIKAVAHMAAEGDLERWVRVMTTFAAPRATLTLIHRASTLDEVLGCLSRRFGGIVVFPVFPRAGEPAKRIIVQGVKGSRAPLRIAPGLVLHDASDAFTSEAEAVLRHGERLRLLG